jgi:hypothetical protein
MKFVSDAIVSHTHPSSLVGYLKKKYKFAFWRIVALRNTPKKGLKDSHTPQVMKLQLLLLPSLLLALSHDVVSPSRIPWSAAVLALFVASTLPFALRALQKDATIGLLSPFLLAARSLAQFVGIVGGTFHSWNQAPLSANSRGGIASMRLKRN